MPSERNTSSPSRRSRHQSRSRAGRSSRGESQSRSRSRRRDASRHGERRGRRDRRSASSASLSRSPSSSLPRSSSRHYGSSGSAAGGEGGDPPDGSKSATSGGKKRRRGDDSDNDEDDEDHPVQQGRGVARLADLWRKPKDLMFDHDQYLELIDEPVPSHLSPEKREERALQLKKLKYAHDAVLTLPRFIPNYWVIIDKSSSTRRLARWFSELNRGAENARSDDVNRLRSATAEWLNVDFHPVADPPLVPHSRDNRGIQHDLCGLLLSPIHHDWEDSSVRARIRAFEDGFELGSHARALYFGYKGDASDVEKGYLQSRLLVKVYLHIFTSPASAREVDAFAAEDDTVAPPSLRRPSTTGPLPAAGHRASRNDVASTLNMGGRVTSRSIAYAAVMLLFQLCSARRWVKSSDGLNFPSIYYSIIDYFEPTPNDPLTQEVTDNLLRWWNRQIFPDAEPSGTAAVDRCNDILAQQRAARRLAAATEDPSSSSSA